jgi:di/tripeptidase
VTTILDPQYSQQLMDRFLRYVKVDTGSDEASESSPTTEKQKDLSRRTRLGKTAEVST